MNQMVRTALVIIGMVISSLVTANASARFAPLEEQPVRPACLIAQTHPPQHIPLCGSRVK